MVDNLLEDKKGKTATTRLSGRLTRTVLLGSIAVAVGIYWLAQSYGVDTAELFGYLKTSLAFVFFFAVIDPIGTVPVFLAVTSDYDAKAQRQIAIRATAISAAILLFFIVAAIAMAVWGSLQQ